MGLPEAIKIKVGSWTHLQKLDYEQLPFKCRECHEYGHFAKCCLKSRTRERKRGGMAASQETENKPKSKCQQPGDGKRKTKPNISWNFWKGKRNLEGLNKQICYSGIKVRGSSGRGPNPVTATRPEFCSAARPRAGFPFSNWEAIIPEEQRL